MKRPRSALQSYGVVSVVLAVVALSFSCMAQSNGVPSPILARVLYVKNGDKTGSAFFIDYKDREYLVTARHVVKGLGSHNPALLFYRSADWHPIGPADVLFPKNPNIDIAVIDLHRKPTLDWNPEPSEESPTIGGQVYFIGYPFGLHTLYSNGEYLPLVKEGTFSGLDNSDPEEMVYYVDGFNNPGFSGGPLVYIDNATHAWRICAVVQGYKPESIKTRVKGQDIDTGLLANSGILLAYPIKYALEAVESKLPK